MPITKGRRRAAARPVSVTDAFVEEPAVTDPAEAIDAAEYRRYLVGRAVRFMRGEFQPATWQAFVEMVSEDRPAAAVAADLGLSVAAVYAAKARVLRRVRQELDGLADWD
ncbi:hypothetical protein [Limnoglobus roseus]|uniref:Sigma-70 family RNA polymerase sigma factor n=1 Tax=Limnoglobus roseus TaxID=2598579 RepID=A0A5C1AQV1_9BACT|nr:hypothetical protein [Limnoglobus roseus]QEL20577.1 sigma-70 family RNA polymerase sigma factor [Limnoglobus roseus]